MCLQFQTKQKNVDVLFTINAQYVGFTSRVLSDLPNVCTKEPMELEHFATKISCRKIRQGDVVKNLKVKAAPRVLVVP